MATSMWRMNGLCKSMAGLLVICTLLLSSEVICQDDDAAAEAGSPPDDTAAGTTPGTSDAPDAAASSGPTPAPDASLAPTGGAGGDTGDATVALAESSSSSSSLLINHNNGGDTSGTFAPDVVVVVDVGAAATEAPADPKNLVVPEVKCVGKEDIPENTAVKAVVDTNDCEATKRVIQENAAPWCNKENCNLEIFQEGNTVSVASSDASHSTLANALKSEHLKDKLGLTKVETPSSSGSSVFVGILVTGLLAAIAITVGYFKCQRKPDAKGVKLAEEAVVDQENQGNTLVSVAPLNPPPETPEKPSVNGESPEAVKTESPPPTNGHSTTKTADTEL